MKFLFFSFLAILGFCAGCTAQTDVKLLTPDEYMTAVNADTTAVILDVRRPSEYAAGHLEGAVLLNFLDSVAFDEGLKSFDKSKTYYLYCRSGRRSNNAAVKMQEQGFKVYDMQGGFLAWQELGKPVVIQ